MKSTLILCADDFGISPGVNRAIADLCAEGRLSAVSCMSSGKAWEEGAGALKPLRDKIDVGLHLTLTFLPPLVERELRARQPSEKIIILKSWARLLDAALVERELRAQFERFVTVWGAPPDFIDGHQHVHVLPVIRDAVLRLRAQYAPRAWVRNVCDFSALAESPKQAVLAVLGWRFRQLLKAHNIPHNTLLRGAYDYARPVDYAARMNRWRALKEPVLVYCHPGFPDAELAKYDAVLEPRRREYDFFKSMNLDNLILARRP